MFIVLYDIEIIHFACFDGNQSLKSNICWQKLVNPFVFQFLAFGIFHIEFCIHKFQSKICHRFHKEGTFLKLSRNSGIFSDT